MKFRNLHKFISKHTPEATYINNIITGYQYMWTLMGLTIISETQGVKHQVVLMSSYHKPNFSYIKIDSNLQQVSIICMRNRQWQKLVIRYKPKLIVSYIINHDEIYPLDGYILRYSRVELVNGKLVYYQFENYEPICNIFHKDIVGNVFNTALNTKWSDIKYDTFDL